MKQLQLLLAFVISSLVTVSCSNPPSVAGATSETTNGISTIVVSSTGYAIKGAEVFIAKADDLRLPGSENRSATALTGDDGKFTIAKQDEVDFIVEVKDSLGNRAMGRFAYDQTEKKHSLVGQANLQLQPTGKIFGDILKLPEQTVTVQIFGLHRVVEFTNADTISHFSIDSLPAGTITIKITADGEEVASDDFTITPKGITNAGVFRTKEFTTDLTDSAIVRSILDLNGKTSVSVESVAPNMKDGKILELMFDNLNLDTIPPVIGKLRLTELSLGSNSIRSLPNEIFKIAQLNYLDISNNPLMSISDDIVSLQSLKTLDIENIGVTTLPISITKSSIEFLFINGNSLDSKTLQPEIVEWINKCAMDKGWSDKQDYEE